MKIHKLRPFIAIIILVIINSASVKAVPIDENLIKENTSLSYIDNLLTRLEKSDPVPEIKVQLLNELKKIQLNDKKVNRGLSLLERSNLDIKNGDIFWDLFKDVASFTYFVRKIEKKIETINQKKSILKKQILAGRNKNDNIQTWQIQYAIYVSRINKLQNNIPKYKNETKQLKNKLSDHLKDISYSSSKLQIDLEQIKRKKQQLKDKLMLFSIEKDQDEATYSQVFENEGKENQVLLEIEQLYLLTGRVKIEESFSYLSLNDPKSALRAIEEASDLTNSSELSDNKEQILKNQIVLARFLLGKKISSFNMLLYNTAHSFREAAKLLFSLASEPLIFFGDKKITIWGTIKFILIFIIGLFLAKYYRRRVTKIGQGRYNITVANKTIISNIGYYLIILVTFFSALNLLGLDLSSLTVVAGALSVGIGFGLQKIFADFMSGIIMMFEKSIKMGDYIEVSSSLRGRVTEIRIRSSTITTNDNISLIIPNSTLMESNVINWTLNDTIVRLKIPFSVAYGTSYKDLENAIISGLENSELNYLKHDKGRETELRMTQMNTSGVDYCLLIWVSGISTKFSEKTKSEFLKFIYNSLSEHNIEIPFPQLDVHVKDGLDT